MATEFKLPDLGEGVEDADVLRVLVSEGSEISLDDPVIEIETEKATVEVPSEVTGRVTRVMVSQGDTIKPGQLLLLVETDGAEAGGAAAAPPAREEAAPAERAPEPAREPAPAERAPAPAAAEEAPAREEAERAPASAREERDERESERRAEPKRGEAEWPAPERAERAAGVEPPGPPEESEAPAAAAPAAGERPIFAAPSVRKFAREIGVELADVRGSGPAGRITEEDVKRHARTAPPPPAAQAAPAERAATAVPPPLPDFSQWGPVERESLSRLRRTVARNMATSWAHIPHVTLQHWADITTLEEVRQEYKERARAEGGNLTISVVMIKIAAAALKAHPRFNASLDLEANELVLKRYYDIGVAVDTDRGLVVPVLREVDQKNIIELSIELNELAERARTNRLTLEEMRGATFTVTNLGSLGTGHFSPIINYPEVSVLGLGRAERVPVWERGEWVPRLRMPLSITVDHRVIDGADGARFLSWIAEAAENPLLLALEG